MIAEIVSLQRGSRKLRNGNDQSGLRVEFLNLSKGTSKKEFLSDYHNAEIISTLEQIGVGGTVDVGYQQNGNYWNVVSAKPASRPDDAPAAGAAGGAKKGGYKKGGSKASEFRSPDQMIRSDALVQAVLTTKMVLDGLSDAARKKVDGAAIVDKILSTAKEFEDYMAGPKAKKSEPKPAEKPAEAPPKDETPPPTDDDAPPVDPDDDDIPF